jgi:hypothetical protein
VHAISAQSPYRTKYCGSHSKQGTYLCSFSVSTQRADSTRAMISNEATSSNLIALPRVPLPVGQHLSPKRTLKTVGFECLSREVVILTYFQFACSGWCHVSHVAHHCERCHTGYILLSHQFIPSLRIRKTRPNCSVRVPLLPRSSTIEMPKAS